MNSEVISNEHAKKYTFVLRKKRTTIACYTKVDTRILKKRNTMENGNNLNIESTCIFDRKQEKSFFLASANYNKV